MTTFFPHISSHRSIVLAASLSNLRFFDIFQAVCQGAQLHASPNAGYPECAFGSAPGVTFGGGRSYGGEFHNAPLLGIRSGECSPLTIRQSVRLMRLTAMLFLVLGVGVRLLLQ